MSAASASKQTSGKKTGGRQRTLSLSDVRCNIANCNYQAKTTKTVENHRLKVHGVTANKSIMDQSVSASILLDDPGTLSDGSLDLKSSTDFYKDMSKVKQSTQLTVSEKHSNKKRKKSDEDEEADKKLKLGTLHQPHQSQGTLDRQVLIKEALASAQKRNDDLNVSESLLENSCLVREFMTDGSFSQSTVEETMVTASEVLQSTEELDETRVESRDQAPGLTLNTTDGNVEEEEFRDMAKDLKLRTESLQDALAQVAQLESRCANFVKEKEYLVTKIESKDQEIKSLTEAIRIMKTSLDQPIESKDQRKVTGLNNKILSLEKKNNDLKAKMID